MYFSPGEIVDAAPRYVKMMNEILAVLGLIQQAVFMQQESQHLDIGNIRITMTFVRAVPAAENKVLMDFVVTSEEEHKTTYSWESLPIASVRKLHLNRQMLVSALNDRTYHVLCEIVSALPE